jgi:phage shock protein A
MKKYAAGGELSRGPQDATDFLSKKISLNDKKSFGKAEEEPQRSAFQRLKDNVIGTEEQNEKAKKEMAEQDAKYPNTTQAKVNRMVDKIKPSAPVKKAKGGMISSASKRGDGCAIKGKTRGRMV